MKYINKLIKLTLVLLTLSATQAHSADIVKMSRSGICHDTTSSWYSKTKNYTAYSTMHECLNDGGRPPKGYGDPNTQKAVSAATQQADKDNVSYSRVYNREEWNHWIDQDNDCQNLRHELLIEQSLTSVTFTNSKQCTVKTGLWYDKFSGKKYTKASQLQIDHIVPLAWAHRHGGANWSASEKEDFANDRNNLWIVKGSLNGSKSAQGPNEWMPPHHEHRCEYLIAFDSVVNERNLKYTTAEQRTITKMLAACDTP